MKDFKNIKLQRLYTAPRPTTDQKKKDMETLLSYIPPIKYAFYQSLLDTPTAEEECPCSDSEDDDGPEDGGVGFASDAEDSE